MKLHHPTSLLVSHTTATVLYTMPPLCSTKQLRVLFIQLSSLGICPPYPQTPAPHRTLSWNLINGHANGPSSYLFSAQPPFACRTVRTFLTDHTLYCVPLLTPLSFFPFCTLAPSALCQVEPRQVFRLGDPRLLDFGSSLLL